MAHCMACVEEGKRLGVKWETTGKDCYMGIDQMGSFNVVIIKRRLPDGRQAVVHVEAIFSDDPFARCGELMRAFGVVICVVEQLPNVNDARRFANEFKGRVYLAGYADLRDDMMQWGDAMTDSDRHTSAEDRTRYTVALHQYKAMQAALYRVRDKFCLFPDPDLLEQEVIENGDRKRVAILRDWVFYHFTKTALVVEENEQTRAKRPKVMKIGIDPHFAFANMLCDIGWARSFGTSMMILPENPMTAAAQTDMAKQVEKSMPGLPKGIISMIADLPAGVCGRCSAYPAAAREAGAPSGLCEMRDLMVGAKDPSCPLYDALSQR
jgi:hypothetical protein